MPAQALKRRCCLSGAAFAPFAAGLVIALSFSSPRCAAQSAGADELSTKETDSNYKLEIERNLVQVRVVVRDTKSHAVGNLRRENFLLLDDGKPQTISHFSAESAETPKPAAAAAPPQKAEGLEAAPETELAPGSPHRYLALYFDDTHMPFEDVALVRRAADKYLASALTPGDRVAVFTASGQGNLDFTSDRNAIQAALLRLQPRRAVRSEMNPCPDIFDYQSYLIMLEHNSEAEDIAIYEALHCHYHDNPQFIESARAEAQMEAGRKLNEYEDNSEAALRGLDGVVGRLGILPGQRSIVLISPGFLTLTLESRIEGIVDRALRTNIIINTLDSRGLYAPTPLGDISEQHVIVPQRPDLMGRKMEFQLTGQTLRNQILEVLSDDTGGFYFHNSNDLEAGFQRVSEFPEAYYSLAFSPEKLKFDGKFHKLKVKLVGYPSLTVEARRGYFAPLRAQSAEAYAKEQITHAVFSQDSQSQIPLEVHTQFFKESELDAILSILARIDLRFLQFRKADGRNLNNLTVVTVLFDQNGNYLEGKEKRVDFRLRDASLEKLAQSGLTMKTSFTVKPGTYMVREVVRDSEGSQISGLTRTVEIPY